MGAEDQGRGGDIHVDTAHLLSTYLIRVLGMGMVVYTCNDFSSLQNYMSV